MGKEFIEQRIIKAGIRLSELRIEQKGTAITADDIRKLKVRTISPFLQINYGVMGVVLMALALLFHFQIRNMAVSMVLLMIGFGNIAYVINGRPKLVSELEGDIDLTYISSEIVDRFIKKMNRS
jgi:hypothetical protein